MIKSVLPGVSLNALDDMGIVTNRQVWHNNTDGMCRVITQAHGKGVGPITMVIGNAHNLLPKGRADTL